MAAGAVGLGAAAIAKSHVVAIAPPEPAPVASAETAVTAPDAAAPPPAIAEPPPPSPVPAQTAPAQDVAPEAVLPTLPSGAQTAAPVRPPLVTLSDNQLTVMLGVLAALLLLGVFWSWSARRARARRADALGDNPLPTTPLKPVFSLLPPATPLERATEVVRSLPPVRHLSRRAAATAWIILTIVVNVVALAKLLQGFGLAHADWHGPFVWLGNQYDAYAGQAFAATSATASREFGVRLPPWLMPVFVLYVSTASAFVVGSAGLMQRDRSAESFLATVVHAGWIFAVPVFVRDAIRYRVVTRFARQNTLLLFAYILTFVGVYICARFINDDLLPHIGPQHLDPAAAVISKIYEDGMTLVDDKR